MKDIHKLVISVIGCELVGVLGTPFAILAINSWYSTLDKPFFTPPSWVFGPVWTFLYFLMGVSFYMIWKLGRNTKNAKIAKMFFFAQLTLNFIWSPVFFGLRSPIFGLIIIIAMWVLILIAMKKFYKLSKVASLLLLPYLLWVTFATLLNAAIVVLN